MRELTQSIGQRLETLLDIFNESSESFMEYADLDIEDFNNIINDYNIPTMSLIKDIASFFKLDEEFVFLGTGKKLSPKLKEEIKAHMDAYDYFGKIDECIRYCKKKLKEDGLPVNSDTIPKFDKKNLVFVSYGAFSKESFPIQLLDIDNKHVQILFDTYTDDVLLPYNLQTLLKLDLIKDLNNFECLDLSTLHSCDDLNVIKEIMDMMENTMEKEDLIDLYNDLLEDLNPNLENFWRIIVLLIDNGAYYTKDYDDDCCAIKDESKTNIVYRLAKEHIKK